MISNEEAILQTKLWIKKVVIDCHFCPFASAPVKNNSVRYVVSTKENSTIIIGDILEECVYLDEHDDTTTTLIILPNKYEKFLEYLDFLAAAENKIKQSGYEGVYQLAGFHPDYLFAGSTDDDASNYTNRSIFPMIHILREVSIDEALANYNHPEKIPENNIAFTQKKGLAYMQLLVETIKKGRH